MGGISISPRKKFQSTDEYIASYPKNIQKILEDVRKAIKNAAPEAEETISYQIPAFKLNGNLVWFAAFKDHIGLYPRASAIEAFKEKLATYKIAKGTIRFPIDKPIPFDLIEEIVRFRVKENLKRR